MAKTFLQAVNDTLKRVGFIAGDSGDLASFTDSARQGAIDIVIQNWNEVVDEIYSLGSLRGEQATGTITLVTDDREYAAPSDYLRMAGQNYQTRVMVSVENLRLFAYPGGYERMFLDQPDPSSYVGQSNYWAMNKANDQFRLDRIPTDSESGDVYSFLYDKRITLAAVADTFPFDDIVVRALVPVVAEIWRLDKNGQPREQLSANAGFNRAVGLLASPQARTRYGMQRSRSGRGERFNPLDE